MMEQYKHYFESAVKASRDIAGLDADLINHMLIALADKAVENTDFLLAENQKDLDRMDKADPKYDRLKLTAERIESIAAEMRNVAALPTPLGHVLSETNRPNGLHISKVAVPLGVVGIIYEARPNVTFDVFVLCFKTGNVCLLKGGSDADYSNQAILSLIHEVLKNFDISTDAAILLPAEREATEALLKATGFVDILIPRGSQGLINFVRENSKVPVIETGAGIVHTYIDESANIEMAAAIILNAKTRRVSVCNALDCLIVHSYQLNNLPALTDRLGKAGVELFADERSYEYIKESYPINLLHHATEEHFGTEFLSMKMAIKTVNNIEEALAHTARHSSKHSEAIISENADHVALFLNKVDAAAVYVNASTAFTDGAQFGLGAEIGISTQKLHARGPMGLAELTSYKWIVKGTGQVRNT